MLRQCRSAGRHDIRDGRVRRASSAEHRGEVQLRPEPMDDGGADGVAEERRVCRRAQQ